MIEMLKAPHHVAAVRLRGEITKTDIVDLRNDIEDKLSGHEKIGVVVDMTEFLDATDAAIQEDIRFEFGLLSSIHRFPRVALVSDKKWVAFIATRLGHLTSGVDIRIFAPGDSDSAISWASSQPTSKNVSHKAALRRIATPSTSPGNVFAFEIDGRMSEAEMPDFVGEVTRFLDLHDRVNMLARIKAFEFEPGILFQKQLWSMKLDALRKVDRYAVVGGPDWLQTTLEAIAPTLPSVKVQAFALSDQDKAWKWLEEGAQ